MACGTSSGQWEVTLEMVVGRGFEGLTHPREELIHAKTGHCKGPTVTIHHCQEHQAAQSLTVLAHRDTSKRHYKYLDVQKHQIIETLSMRSLSLSQAHTQNTKSDSRTEVWSTGISDAD